MFRRSTFQARWLFQAFALILFALTFASGAHAQDTRVDLTADLSEAEFQALLGRLSDEQVRDILIAEFAARRTTEAAPAEGLLTSSRDIGDTLTTNAAALFAKMPELGSGIGAILARLSDAGGTWLAFLALAISLGAGGVVRYFWRKRAAERQIIIAERNLDKGSYGTIGTILDAGFFLVIELSGSIAFALTAMATLYLFFHNPDIRFFASSYVAVVTVVLVVLSMASFIFPLNWPIYRLVALSDEATRRVHRVVVWLSGLWMFEVTTTDIMAQFGAPDGTHALLSMLLGLLWITTAIAGTFWIHRATTDLLPSLEDRSLINTLSRNWAAITAVILLFTWAVFTGGALLSGNVDAVAARVFFSMLVFLGLWMGYRILIHYLRAQTMNPAVRMAIGNAARALLFATGLIIVLETWGLSPAVLSASGGAGRTLQTIINVLLTAIIGWAIWDFLRTIIDVRVAAEKPVATDEEPGEAEGGEGATRTATLLPLLRSTAMVVIGMTCLFAVLSSLGINVGPLIAGAGVVGLAVGFGAQTLVKDVVSGVFFLFDDAFRLNEFIDVGGASGAVERISLRSITLRDSKGPVLIIPYGEIKNVTNFGRDWGIMKLRFTLPFDTDIEQVRKIFKRIGQEMLEDPALGPSFIEPFKSQGVAEFNDYGVVVRAKFTHKPGKQFEIRKRAFTRIKEEFDKAGIQFARREVKVNLGDGRESLSEEQTKRVAAAAAEAVSQADRDAAAQAASAVGAG